AVRQALRAEAAGDLARKTCADGAVAVQDAIGQAHFPLVLERFVGVTQDLWLERAVVGPDVAALDVQARLRPARIGRLQHAPDVDCSGPTARRRGAPLEQVGATDYLVERAEADRGQNLAHLLRQVGEVVDDLLRRALELRPQVVALGRDTGRTGVRMAQAGHVATEGHNRGGPEAELLGPEHRGHDDVPAGLQAAVGAGDQVAYLVARQLAALAWLGALRHLDLELLGHRQVFGGHAEAGRGDLLDLVVGNVAVRQRQVVLGVLAALAGVTASADPIHRD